MSKADKYRLPVHTAVAYTAKWRELEYLNRKDPATKVRAFNVHLSELKDILDEIGVERVRFYLGINTEHKETLVLVGVNDKNEDMIEARIKEDGSVEEVGTYDFSYPCPDTCAEGDSPLNQD